MARLFELHGLLEIPVSLGCTGRRVVDRRPPNLGEAGFGGEFGQLALGVTVDTILGGLTVYVLLGITFTNLYAAVDDFTGNALFGVQHVSRQGGVSLSILLGAGTGSGA